jgi:hypothetical protein
MPDLESELQLIAEEQDEDVDAIRQEYEEQLEEVREKAADIVEDDELEGLAIGQLRSKYIQKDRVGGGGEKLEILAIGHTGEQKWSNGDGGKKRVVKSYGIINPETGPPGVAVFINDETTGVDLGEVMQKFQPLNSMIGWYRRSQSDTLSNTYICNSTDKTRLEIQDVGGIPDSDADRRELLHKLSDGVEIENIPNQISVTNDSGYPADFGADLKRLVGQVTNRYVNEEKGFGIYKIMDRSVVSREELDGLNVMGENDRVPGLSVWCNPDEMAYGEDSELEIYGQVRVVNSGANEGQIVMDSYGIIPLIEREVEESDGGSSSSANDNVEEKKI